MYPTAGWISRDSPQRVALGDRLSPGHASPIRRHARREPPHGTGPGDEEELAEVLHAVDLTAFVESLPLLYQQPLGPGASRLSSGQRQRVALARAFLRKPRILILDEATSSMDAVAEQIVLDRTRLLLPFSTVVLLSTAFLPLLGRTA